MPVDPLNEREFELINIVGADLGANQRDVSRLMNLSLGMVNMLIRRLITKGYIRVEQLDNRKTRYLLTPKGFAEKMRKSVKYTLKTINSLSLIKNRVKEIILRLHKKGHRDFYILGKSDFGSLVEMVIKEVLEESYTLKTIPEIPAEDVKGVILICKEIIQDKASNINNRVDLIRELAQDSSLMRQANGGVLTRI